MTSFHMKDVGVGGSSRQTSLSSLPTFGLSPPSPCLQLSQSASPSTHPPTDLSPPGRTLPPLPPDTSTSHAAGEGWRGQTQTKLRVNMTPPSSSRGGQGGQGSRRARSSNLPPPVGAGHGAMATPSLTDVLIHPQHDGARVSCRLHLFAPPVRLFRTVKGCFE